MFALLKEGWQNKILSGCITNQQKNVLPGDYDIAVRYPENGFETTAIEFI